MRTGKRLWIFHTIPKPGEFGIDTWQNDSWSYTGNTGVWAQISVDEQLELALSSGRAAHRRLLRRPSPRRRPVRRKPGRRRSANRQAQVALPVGPSRHLGHGYSVRADPRRHHRQRPTVKAVAQPTKQAFLYVFDRVPASRSGRSRRSRSPQGDVPGEWYSPTQPFPDKPPAYDRQGVSLDDLIDFTPELHEEAVKLVSKYKIGPMFTPPVVSKLDGPLGTLVMRRTAGGTNWPGGSFDPETHTVYVFSQTGLPASRAWCRRRTRSLGYELRSGQRGGRQSAAARRQRRVAAGGRGRGSRRRGCAAGGGGSGEGGGVDSRSGLPLLKPPYGRITAIDLDKGEIAWQIAHGETPDNISNNPALKGLTSRAPAAPESSATLITKTLVIAGEAGFFTTPNGQRGAMLRAYDKATGKEVGAVYMPAPQSGSPMTYMLNGQQYIVLAISGAGYSGRAGRVQSPRRRGANRPHGRTGAR